MSNTIIRANLSALFVPCYYDGLPRDSGSARIRAEWVVRYWDGAHVYHMAQPLVGYDLYVFQKAYLVKRTRKWIRTVARWRDLGACKLAFDLCDPDFLDEGHKRRLLKVLPFFDFAVATTEPIKAWLEEWLPTHLIPDRVDLAEISRIKAQAPAYEPQRPAGDAPQTVWCGYAANAKALEEMLPAIDAMEIPLTIITIDRPVPFNEFWTEVLKYDVLLNPRPDVPPFSYKSDNKTLIAWALGVPVARTIEELERFRDPAERYAEVCRREREVLEKWDVRLSVEQWKSVTLGS